MSDVHSDIYEGILNEILEQCVANHGKPKIAIRNMEEAGCFQNINRPSMEQLYNKMAAMKKLLNKNPNLTNTFEMRQLVSQHLDIPEDPDDAYIPFYEIKDDDSHDLRFNIMFFCVPIQVKFVLKRLTAVLTKV